MQSADVLVVGAGHNGLVNAAYLAEAGLKVIVLERRPIVGGPATTEEVFPGFKYLTGAYLVSLLRPEVIDELDLARCGMELLPLETTYQPLPDGDYLAEWPDHDRTRDEIARHSPKDADGYGEFTLTMRRLALGVKPLLALIPPNLVSPGPDDEETMSRIGACLREMPRSDFQLLSRLLTMSAAEFLEGWFESEAIKGTKGASGIIGSFMGPRSPGTGYVLLHHYLGEIDGVPRAWGVAKGGTLAVCEAIALAAKRRGVEIRLNCPVAQILTKDGKATGVVLENGDELRAPLVVSNADAAVTFTKLCDPRDLPPPFLADVKRYRTRSPACKVNFALDGLPTFTSLPKGKEALLRGSIEIAPSLDYLEQAYDDAKYGGTSRRPFMDALIPSLLDPGLAPPGKHVMSMFVQYAASDVEGGWTEARREAFLDTVVETLAEYAPDLPARILHRHLNSPADLERSFGLTNGHIFHGELALHQLFLLRPSPGWAQYKTPIPGLWMCGSSTHPGGCITGAPGRNAARAILRHQKEARP